MQTFLPYKDFRLTAKSLDYRRLGKQRVECLQILKALNNETKGWVNHPAVKMWKGHESYLVSYGLSICEEWISRGYKDTCYDKIKKYSTHTSETPPWLGNEEFHDSHKSNLLRKDEKFYSQYNWNVPSNLEYIWP